MTILVCGEALYDFFQTDAGSDGSLSFDARVGGSPFNVAIGIARQNGEAALLTGMSNDLLGQRLSQRLTQEGVATEFLIRSGKRTTLSLVGLDAAGHPDYAFYGVGSADVAVTPQDMPELSEAIDALHFGSYSIAVAPAADAFYSLAERNSGLFLSLDPNVRPTVEADMDVWRARIDQMRSHCDLIKVSAEDLEMLYPGTAALDIARNWQSGGTELVVVTAGSQDTIALTQAGEISIPARPVGVVDTVGAGDSFQATLLRGLQERGAFDIGPGWAQEIDLEAVLNKAVHAGSIVCGRTGADLPRSEDFAA